MALTCLCGVREEVVGFLQSSHKVALNEGRCLGGGDGDDEAVHLADGGIADWHYFPGIDRGH